ncbi:hypothetical protein ABIB34_003963 [Rhodococcus sp. UYP5]
MCPSSNVDLDNRRSDGRNRRAMGVARSNGTDFVARRARSVHCPASSRRLLGVHRTLWQTHELQRYFVPRRPHHGDRNGSTHRGARRVGGRNRRRSAMGARQSTRARRGLFRAMARPASTSAGYTDTVWTSGHRWGRSCSPAPILQRRDTSTWTARSGWANAQPPLSSRNSERNAGLWRPDCRVSPLQLERLHQCR